MLKYVYDTTRIIHISNFAQIRGGKIGSLFRPDTFITGNTGAGNNWAKGCKSRHNGSLRFEVFLHAMQSTQKVRLFFYGHYTEFL